MNRSGWCLQVGTDAQLESESRFLSTEVGANRRWHKARRDNPGKLVDLYRVCEGGQLAGNPFRSNATEFWRRIDRERAARQFNPAKIRENLNAEIRFYRSTWGHSASARRSSATRIVNRLRKYPWLNDQIPYDLRAMAFRDAQGLS